MRTLVVSFLMAGMLAACSGDGPVSVAAQVELTQHEAMWRQRGIHSYDFDLVKQQFGITYRLHVIVRADTVDHIIDNGSDFPPTFPGSAMTVDDVFADAQSAITRKDLEVSLDFDQQYGYPTRYAVASVLGNPGGPFSAQLSNLVPVQ